MSRWALVGLVLGMLGCGASDDAEDRRDPNDLQNQPPASCLRRCVDDNESCSLGAVEDFPTLALTQDDWEAKCNAQRPFLWRGACEDGKQVLAYSTGHNGERRVYDGQGEFLSVVEFTDSGAAPCYGQGYWPAFPKCEAPSVVEAICGQGHLVGDPKPLWVEPQTNER